MALTKMVNGVCVTCSPEEEQQILAEWAANSAKPTPAPSTTIDGLQKQIVQLTSVLETKKLISSTDLTSV